MSSDTIAQTALAATQAAGKILITMYDTAKVSSKAASFDLVTEADMASQQCIKDIIHEHYPHHHFLGEEGDHNTSLEAEHLWIVDPLDGTNNYAHHIPHFAVSIAYAYRGEIQVGYVFDPMRNELFAAVKDNGSTLNGNPITVSDRKTLQESVIATGFYYDRGALMEHTIHAIAHLFKQNIVGIRRMGSAALDICWVAAGRYAGYFEYKLNPWDFAAGSLIAHEAGGMCTDSSGTPLSLQSKSIICSNGKIHHQLLDNLK